MELPLDAHTHHLLEVPSLAIVNIRFPQEAFEPVTDGYYSVGIHPWDVHLQDETHLDWKRFTALAAHPQVLAIGECGMDKLVNGDMMLRQERIFSRQVDIAQELGKPLMIHNVRSSAAIWLCKEHSNCCQNWVLHGFRRGGIEAIRALDHGFMLSFGPIYNEEALRCVPLDKLLLETDDSGVDILEVYRRVALMRGISVGELTWQVQQNIQRVFFTREEL